MARSIYFYTDSSVLGGAENAMLMLLESLERRVWAPTLLLDEAPGADPIAVRAEELRVPVRRVEPLPLGLTGARRAPRFARLLRTERPSVFHAHMSSPVACKWALAAAVAARVPVVLGTVQVGEYEPPDRSSYWQLRALARGVDRYLAVSGAIAEELADRLRWPPAKIEVVYNAVDVARFEVEPPPGLRESLGAGPGRSLVLTAARLDPQKGHRFLLEALARVPDAVLALAGDGPERATLEATADRLGVADRVTFLGRREDVPELLAACDVFALPSLYEGSSLAVLEAMAARRPIVSSAIGGTDELIEDGREGLLVQPGDPDALASALNRAIGDRELREALAERARERVERGLTREQMARRVAGVYAELLGAPPVEEEEELPEPRRNDRLRREDWRFLLPDAELLARRRVPRIGGARRLRERLERDGCADVRVYWPGPLPNRLPQFWLPVESGEAVAHLLAGRPPSSPLGAALRRLWRGAWRAGLLAPLYAVGRRPQEPAEDALPIPDSASLLLLTGGKRSINKAVGLAFEAGSAAPGLAAKFARVPEAEPGLRREADVLSRLGAERPSMTGVPRLLGTGRRCDRFAVVERAVEGGLMLDRLDADSFAGLSERITALLIEIAAGDRDADREDAAQWRERLVELPLRRLEAGFGAVLPAEAVPRARDLLGGLGEFDPVVEHRDCSPWNVVLGAGGEPTLLDWESAEPDGLPGMDLVYFLANCVFVLDGAIESGRTRESYRRMLDPSTRYGRVAAEAFERYRDALGMDSEDLRRIRLLCWIVHSRSDYHHLEMDSRGAPPPEALRGAPFLGLVEEELGRG